jgi:retinol dehydrogenase 12
VVVSAVNPGFCHSRLTREAESQFPTKWMISAFKALVARSTEMGSFTLVHAVTDADERKFHGHYVSNCEVAEESDLLLDAEGTSLSHRIWVSTHPTACFSGSIDLALGRDYRDS